VALIAITSLAIPGVNDAYWLSRAFWIASVSCSLLSAAYACNHIAFMANVLLENPEDPWTLKRWFQDGDCNDQAKPCLQVALLLSGSKMFFSSALITYIFGMGIYLDNIWRWNLNAITNQYTSPEHNPNASAIWADSRNIFVVFAVIVATCFCLYQAFSIQWRRGRRVSSPEWEEWKRIECKFRNHEKPFPCNRACFGNPLPGNGLDLDLKVCCKHYDLTECGEEIHYANLTNAQLRCGRVLVELQCKKPGPTCCRCASRPALQQCTCINGPKLENQNSTHSNWDFETDREHKVSTDRATLRLPA